MGPGPIISFNQEEIKCVPYSARTGPQSLFNTHQKDFALSSYSKECWDFPQQSHRLFIVFLFFRLSGLLIGILLMVRSLLRPSSR
jgi:hypothetical protein